MTRMTRALRPRVILSAMLFGLMTFPVRSFCQELRIYDNRGMIRMLHETQQTAQVEVTFQGGTPLNATLVRIDAAQGQREGRMMTPHHFIFFDVSPGSWRIDASVDQESAHVFKVEVSNSEPTPE